MSIEMAQFDVRLTSLEAAVTQVQEKLGIAPPTANWVEQFAGSLADLPEDDYQEFLRCCRAVREEGAVEDSRK